MNPEKPYQPTKEEIEKAGNSMDWMQEGQSYDREADVVAEKEGSTLSEFFTSRPGFHVYQEFRDNILKLGNEEDSSEIPHFHCVDLRSDSTIRNVAQVRQGTFTLNQIRAFIEQQPTPNVSGPLNTTLHVANLFPVKQNDAWTDTVTVTSVGGSWSVDNPSIMIAFSEGVRVFRKTEERS